VLDTGKNSLSLVSKNKCIKSFRILTQSLYDLIRFYRHLAGIQQQKGTHGYSKLNIVPPPTSVLLSSVLTSVKAIFGTPNGNVAVSWQRSGGDIFAKATPVLHIVVILLFLIDR
jgi:hypothetical protein